MKQIIGIDPGGTTGWAVVSDETGTWRLTRFGSVDVSRDNAGIGLLPGAGLPVEVVVEVPRWRRYGNPGDPNDLLTLAKRAGMCVEFYRQMGLTALEVWPEDWKGGVAKTIHHRRVLAALTPDELELVAVKAPTRTNPHGVDHNELDAIGIALWRCGRLPRGG